MATSARPMDVQDGLLHTRAMLHLLGDGDLSPLARLLCTVFEHDMGLDLMVRPAHCAGTASIRTCVW